MVQVTKKDEVKQKSLEILKKIFEDKICEKFNSEIMEIFGENTGIGVEAPYVLPEGLEEDNENIKKMEEWIREGGGSTSGLEVRFVSDVYRGVFLRDNAKVKYFYLNNLERKNSKFDPT